MQNQYKCLAVFVLHKASWTSRFLVEGGGGGLSSITNQKPDFLCIMTGLGCVLLASNAIRYVYSSQPLVNAINLINTENTEGTGQTQYWPTELFVRRGSFILLIWSFFYREEGEGSLGGWWKSSCCCKTVTFWFTETKRSVVKRSRKGSKMATQAQPTIPCSQVKMELKTLTLTKRYANLQTKQVSNYNCFVTTISIVGCENHHWTEWRVDRRPLSFKCKKGGQCASDL